MKRYVRGERFQEGFLEFQVVPGGYVVGYGTSLSNCFVPDPNIQVFDTQEDLDAAIEAEAFELQKYHTYWNPLTEGERAWIEAMHEARPKLAMATIERQVRDMRISGEPLIYSFADKKISAENVQPLVGLRSWWKRLWGAD